MSGASKLTDQALRCTDREAHADIENDGQEVCDRVSDGSGQTEQASKGKNLQIQNTSHVLAQVERFGDDVVAILLDPGADESSFSLAQERQSGLGAFGRKLREVYDGDTADEADNDRDDALHDEDPSPASDTRHDASGCSRVLQRGSVVLAIVGAKVTEAVHLPEAIC